MNTVTGTLHGYGRLPWADLKRLLDGWSASWGDTDGMHLDEGIPDQPPAYTHLWAWTRGTYARVRIDLPAQRHRIAILATDGATPRDTGLQAISVEPVTADVTNIVSWADHGRVIAVPAQFRRPQMTLQRLVTRHHHAITFVRTADA